MHCTHPHPLVANRMARNIYSSRRQESMMTNSRDLPRDDTSPGSRYRTVKWTQILPVLLTHFLASNPFARHQFASTKFSSVKLLARTPYQLSVGLRYCHPGIEIFNNHKLVLNEAKCLGSDLAIYSVCKIDTRLYIIWLIRKWAKGTWADWVGSIPVTVGVDSAQGLDTGYDIYIWYHTIVIDSWQNKSDGTSIE